MPVQPGHMPCVSVIIPTYNRAAYVVESIRSVCAQTYADFEVIVVDDGSTDHTEPAIAAIADARIHYVKQANTGRSHARNQALKLARGRYIAFLDSDDMYVPEKLEMQVGFMDAHPEVGMVYTSARCIDAAGTPIDAHYVASVSGEIYSSVAFFQPVTITLPTVMVRAEILAKVGGFDECMHRFEDTDMWRRVSKHTSIAAMPYVTCILRTHTENSLRAQDPEQIMSAIAYYAQKIWDEDAVMGRVLLRKGIARLHYYYSQAFFSIPEWRMFGFHLLKRAVVWWPPMALKFAYWQCYFFLRTSPIHRYYKHFKMVWLRARNVVFSIR